MPNPQNHSSDKNIDPALAETVPQMATAVTMPIEEIKTIWSGVKETQTLEQTINMTQQMSDIGTRTIKKQTGPATIGVQVTQKFVANQRDAAGAIPAFEITQVLGQGGMGVVYEARQTSIDRLIALKMIRSDRDANNQAREKFLAEAVVTGDLDHPNIISVHDLGETQDGNVFYAMKKVSGQPWCDTISSRTQSENLQILLQISQAMAYAHDKGVIHRDLKPENVMIGAYGEVILMDWGLAMAVTPDAKAAMPSVESAIGGTPAYMAPEMATGDLDALGTRSDIYLLGAILFEIITGKYPHGGKSIAECLQNVSGNIFVEHEATGELYNIAMHAMAAKPEDRYQSAKAFIDAIHAFQEHEASLQTTDQAITLLTQAEASGKYDLFAEAQFSFKQAIKQWSNNQIAIKELTHTQQSYANCAMNRRDYDLALSLLQANIPEHQSLIKTVQEKIKQEQAFKKRTILIKYGALGLFLIICCSVWYILNEYNKKFSSWLPVYSNDFSSTDASLDQLSFYDQRSQNAEEPWALVPGKGLETKVHEWCWINEPIKNDTRIEVSFVFTKNTDALILAMNSRLEDVGDSWSLPAGLNCQIAGYYGSKCGIFRNDRPSRIYNGTLKRRHFESGKVYSAVFEKHDHTIHLSVDGTPCASFTDYLPIQGEKLERVGFKTYTDGLIIKKITVSKYVLPEHPSPTVAGDALLKRGDVVGAYESYREMADDYHGTEAAQLSLAKAYMTLLEFDDNTKKERSALLKHFKTTYPKSAYLTRPLEMEIISLYKQLKLKAAFNLMPMLFEIEPDTTILEQMLKAGRTELSQDDRTEFIKWIRKSKNIEDLDISGMGFDNLEFVRELPLKVLTCEKNNISDLSPLAGLPLTELYCADNNITSLESLRGMMLTDINCARNNITSLEPLTGMPLRSVHCGENAITDITPIAAKSLKRLRCNNNQIESLDALAGIDLSIINFSWNKITRIDALSGSGIYELIANGNKLKDLTPISHMKNITSIYLANCGLTDLSALENLNIQSATLGNNELHNIDVIKTWPIRKLGIANNNISDLMPLAGKPIYDLRIGNNKIKDLTPLKTCTSLKRIFFSDNQVEDVSGLSNAALTILVATGNRIRSLKPLQQDSYDTVMLHNNPITELGRFEQWAPKTYFTFSIDPFEMEYLDSVLANWKNNHDPLPTAYHTLGYEMWIKDKTRPKTFGHIHNGHHYYLVDGVNLNWEAAKAHAQSLGGHLATINTDDEYQFIIKNFITKPKVSTLSWIGGLRNKETNAIEWISGEPFKFRAWSSGHPIPEKKYLGFLSQHSLVQTFNQSDSANYTCGHIIEWE